MKTQSAFPWSIDNGESVKGEKGMTLRDYFAAKAMQTIYQKHWEMFMDETYDIPEDVRTGTAEEAYAIADEMLKARGA